MPEAAEVHLIANMIRGRLGGVVKSAKVLSGRYARRPIKGLDALEGCKLDGVVVKGKLIVLCFTPLWCNKLPQIFALSTMGMTGYWENRQAVSPPKHSRICFEFETGRPLDFCDARNFGTFKVVGRKEVERKLMELGFDLLHDDVDLDVLTEKLRRFAKKKTIAEALLDQRVIAGVGNYIRADAMYKARIDPRVPATDLTLQQLKDLADSCRSIAWASTRDRHPYDENRRFGNICYNRSIDEDGDVVESYVDRLGRTVWWCPTKQAVTG